MKKKYLLTFCLLLLFVLLAMPIRAHAQDAVPAHVFETTRPVSSELRSALDDWLSTDNPSAALYYVVTYTQPDDGDMLVSLAGFDTDQEWSLTGNATGESHLVWMDSVRVADDGTVTMFSPHNQQQTRTLSPFVSASLLSMINPASVLFGGGNVDYKFPFDVGKTVMYGPLGVHAAGYTGSGETGDMVAVDLVSGTDMGVNFATGWVWPSAIGDVSFVCEDSDSTAVVVKSMNGDRFLYAHLLDNADLTLGHSFVTASIGYLKKGSFGSPGEGCGWAEQRSTQYHLHWGIEPAAGVFRVESCVLRADTGNWTCGDTTISPGEYIMSRGINDTTDPYSSPTLFDNILTGMLNIYDKAVVQNMPEQSGNFALLTPIMNAMSIVFRVLNVLVMGNLNCVPAVGLLLIAITLRLQLGAIWLVGAVLRTIKAIPAL